MSIRLYEIDNRYIAYLLPHAPHMFHSRQPHQANERKYIGIVLEINGMKYFAALSSFKPKHEKMKESLDMLKIGDYAVLNLNLMFPVPDGLFHYVDISRVADPHYRALLQAEYRIIKRIQDRIFKNAATIYRHRITNGDATPLGKRCNDFPALEQLCRLYRP